MFSTNPQFCHLGIHSNGKELTLQKIWTHFWILGAIYAFITGASWLVFISTLALTLELNQIKKMALNLELNGFKKKNSALNVFACVIWSLNVLGLALFIIFLLECSRKMKQILRKFGVDRDFS